MAGKTRMFAALSISALSACTTVPETAAPAPPAAAAALPRTAPPAAKAAPTGPEPRSAPRPSPTRPTQTATPAAPPSSTINANVTRNADDSLLISRGSNTQLVPLFRQAIVLANVRAAVAGLPVPPKAEFNRGLLTLTFPPGSTTDAAAAINQVLAVPEVTRLRAKLPR